MKKTDDQFYKKDIHPCIGCGKTTTARWEICDKCLRYRKHKWLKKSAVSDSIPTELLEDEFSYDYSEEALGPHGIDDRIGWEFVEIEYETID